MLNFQSLGPGFKEAGRMLFSLVVACWTANLWVLGPKESGNRLVILVVACWTANGWFMGSIPSTGWDTLGFMLDTYFRLLGTCFGESDAKPSHPSIHAKKSPSQDNITLN